MAVVSIDIQQYLQLAKVTNKLPKRDFWTAYDLEADVFYISFHEPALPADDSELTDDDVIIRYDRVPRLLASPFSTLVNDKSTQLISCRDTRSPVIRFSPPH